MGRYACLVLVDTSLNAPNFPTPSVRGVAAVRGLGEGVGQLAADPYPNRSTLTAIPDMYGNVITRSSTAHHVLVTGDPKPHLTVSR